MKTVYLIPGWDGNPNNNWFPWLKKELEKRDFKVFSLAMPDPKNPKIDKWVGFLRKNVKADKNAFFVGHSMGCRAIIGFLENHKGTIGGVVFVAGWVTLTNLESRREKEIAKQWTSKRVDYKKVKNKTRNFVAVFSDNDPYVPFKENTKAYQKNLGAKIIIEKGKGHFSDEEGIKELPIALKELLEMAK